LDWTCTKDTLNQLHNYSASTRTFPYYEVLTDTS
jgi:hypothetical protein